MKRWAFLVAGLYLLALAVVVAPLIVMGLPDTRELDLSQRFLGAYSSWGFWISLVAVATIQFALLAVPVRVASRRPVTRGALWPTVLAGGFMFGLLVLGALLSIEALLFSDELPGPGAWVWWPVWVGVASWLLWALIFHRASKAIGPEDLVKKATRQLFRGSILELLVAVPTHIVVRQRNTCCAEVMTFYGLVFGIAVMLFAYGPSVFFLFAERWRRLHPEAAIGKTPGSVT